VSEPLKEGKQMTQRAKNTSFDDAVETAKCTAKYVDRTWVVLDKWGNWIADCIDRKTAELIAKALNAYEG